MEDERGRQRKKCFQRNTLDGNGKTSLSFQDAFFI